MLGEPRWQEGLDEARREVVNRDNKLEGSENAEKNGLEKWEGCEK